MSKPTQYAKTLIKSRRCDKAMRRSKERCNTPYYTRWKCKGECRTCICCIVKDENGDERHVGRRYEC